MCVISVEEINQESIFFFSQNAESQISSLSGGLTWLPVFGVWYLAFAGGGPYFGIALNLWPVVDICCVNTALVLFIFARRHNELGYYMQQVKIAEMNKVNLHFMWRHLRERSMLRANSDTQVGADTKSVAMCHCARYSGVILIFLTGSSYHQKFPAVTLVLEWILRATWAWLFKFRVFITDQIQRMAYYLQHFGRGVGGSWAACQNWGCKEVN